MKSTRWLSLFLAASAAAFALAPRSSLAQSAPTSCQTDADCGKDATCEKPASTPACKQPPCDTTPTTASVGTCAPVAHACATNADCAAPLQCQASASDGTCSSDGTTTTCETAPPGPKVCTYVVVTCADDAACGDSRYECAHAGTEISCTGSGGTTTSGGSSGGSGSAPSDPPSSPTGSGGSSVSTPVGPVGTADAGADRDGDAGSNTPPDSCTSVEQHLCFPKRHDCTSNTDCGAAWVCFTFDDQSGVPPWWNAPSGTRSCLPQGLVDLAAGHATVVGNLGAVRGANEGGTLSSAGGSDKGTSAPPATSSPTGSAASTSSTPSAGGCAIATRGRASAPWLTLAGVGLVGLIARARRRRR